MILHFGFNRSGRDVLDSYVIAFIVSVVVGHVSIAQARCFGFLHHRANRGTRTQPQFQSLRRDVLDSYATTQNGGTDTQTVSIAQARCFGFLR